MSTDAAPLLVFRPEDASGTLPICYFHALAEHGLEGLVLIEPQDVFVSVGAFDDTAALIDLAFCRSNGIPVVRRATGGGPVLLGPGQVFYTLVVKRGRPGIPGIVARAYDYLSQAPIAAYRALGIDARLRPINDLVTAQDRKISGQGAADIEGSFCFVGSLLRHFDVDLMCRVLRAPDSAFRARLRSTMDANMTWMARELAAAPDNETVTAALERAFASLLGPLHAAALPPATIALAGTLAQRFTSDEVLLEETGRRHRGIKIREGVYVHHGAYRGDDFMLAADITTIDERIEALALRGDLVLPYAEIGAQLSGVAFERSAVATIVEQILPGEAARVLALVTAVCLGERPGRTTAA